MLQIRELEKDDLLPLLALYTHLHDNPMPAMDEALLMKWGYILSDPNHHIIGGFLADQLISSCVLLIVPNLTHNQRPYALIEHVITHEAYRGHGYAMSVLQFAKALAQKRNCYKIMLMTSSQKESTLMFYERAGYNRHDKTAFIQWLS